MNTTFDDFIIKTTGKPIDFDGVFPNQCMDLMHSYVYDVLNLKDKKLLAAPSAYLVYQNFLDAWKPFFKKIDNTPTGVPKKGDIVFWGQGIGPHGHVAIFVDGDANKFNSFDANFPTGSLPHIQNHTYKAVLGWLRPITQPPTDDDSYITLKAKYDKLVKDHKELQEKYATESAHYIAEIERIQAQASELTLQLGLVSKEKDIALTERDALKLKVGALEAENSDIEELNNSLTSTNAELKLKLTKKLMGYSKGELLLALVGIY